MKKSKLLMILCGLLLLLFSCSRSEPKIAYGVMRLVYLESNENPVERFSFFVLPEDNDGIEDIEELYLYHDREGLMWQLSAVDWVSYEVEGRYWIGSHNIAMADNEPLPRGLFRAVLVDKGGEKSERTFAFDAPEESRYPFPLFTLTGGSYRVESGYPDNYLICYDLEGNYIKTQPLTAYEGVFTDLDLPSNVAGVALWTEDPEYHVSALTDVVATP
ncbi:MAG: hypothetical protein LBD78_04255 [Spirochaetaceae bacterium]|jgi:hypothetical protein|nr:hypothetical protein [Spirochaetaceae bacterium]